MSLLFEAERPASYWDVVGAHLPWALMSGVVLLVAWLVPLGEIPLPQCLSLRLTEVPCPFCGLTRSFVSIARGELASAIYNYPLAIVLYVLIACHCAWNTAALLVGRRLRRGTWLRWTKRYTKLIGIVTVLAIAANWVYRLCRGLM